MSNLKEAHDLIRDYVERWIEKKRSRRKILGLFSPNIIDHPRDTTEILDYSTWHANPSELDTGSGRLLSVTHNEIQQLWSQPESSFQYDAFLLRHLRKGGSVSRVFVLGKEYADNKFQDRQVEVMYRHQKLDLKPYVVSVHDLHQISQDLGIKCDTFGVLNDRFAYYYQFVGEYPRYIRTNDPQYVKRAIRCHNVLLRIARPFEKWRKDYSIQINSEQVIAIEQQCGKIRAIALVKT